MEKYKELTICEDSKTVIKIKEEYSANYHYYGLKAEDLLNEIEEKRKELKLNIKEFVKSTVTGLSFMSLLPIFIANGMFGNSLYPHCTILGSITWLLGFVITVDRSIIKIPSLISGIRENHINKKNKKKIEKLMKKGLLKDYFIEPNEFYAKQKNIEESIKKEPSITEMIAKLEKEKYDLLHRTEHPTKVIEYKTCRHNDKEDGVIVTHTTVHSPRYEFYKEFVIDHGGDKKLFDLPAINNIIDYVIKYADGRVKMDGRSPLYYKCPNEDGTFDICGRMNGPSVTVVYKMEYCHDGNPEHYIVLKKYEQKSHFAGCYYYIDGCGYSKIYINKQGIIVEETKEIEISGFKNEGFLNELYEKKLLKRDSLDMLLTKKKTL